MEFFVATIARRYFEIDSGRLFLCFKGPEVIIQTSIFDFGRGGTSSL